MVKKRVMCIGSTALDIRGHPSQEIPLGSISPGLVYFGLGGIAYQMAENFTRLSCESYLLSVVGMDIFGDFILFKVKELGIHTEFIERCNDHPTARLVAVLDTAGETQKGVFDGSIIEHISPSYLKRHSDLITSADLIVTNTIVPIPSLILLSTMAQENAIPFYINTTSVILARRALSVIDKSTILGANRREAENLAGLAIQSPSEAVEAGKSLVLAGAREVIITLGSEGVIYCNSSSSYHRKALPSQVVNTVGAGDALCSGFLSCVLNGHGIEYSLEYGLSAAAITVESQDVVSPFLSPSAVKNRMRDEVFPAEDAR